MLENLNLGSSAKKSGLNLNEFIQISSKSLLSKYRKRLIAIIAAEGDAISYSEV